MNRQCQEVHWADGKRIVRNVGKIWHAEPSECCGVCSISSRSVDAMVLVLERVSLCNNGTDSLHGTCHRARTASKEN